MNIFKLFSGKTEDTPDILKQIIKRKQEEVAERSEHTPLRLLSQQAATLPPPRGFVSAIDAKIVLQQPAIIAEIKKASPSKGVLRDEFNPNEIAKSYERSGATCLSVLTDTDFFQGTNAHLRQAREACFLPILRKDFIIDPYQVYEAKAMGADCILLIVAALPDSKLQELSGLAEHLKLDVLVEVHNREELERALPLNLRLIGINNRDLRTFKTNIKTTLDLIPLIPKKHLIVSESGINSSREITTLRKAGVNAFLVGEAFMVSRDPGAALAKLIS